MSDTILKLDKLSKTFRSHWVFRQIQAVKSVSLEVKRGEAFGFLGHNGAGKTTAIKCIVGLIRTTAGTIELAGKPLKRAEQLATVGYLPEQPYFYDHLTIEETLHFMGQLHGMPTAIRRDRVEEMLETLGLKDRRRNHVRSLSKGLQQRLGFAQSIINKPELLILDEPFAGLDPVGRVEIRNLILRAKQEGTTIFLSSHILSDVEDICDRVCILSKGEVRASFSMADAADLYGEKLQLTLSGLAEQPLLKDKLDSLATATNVRPAAHGEQHTLTFSTYAEAREAISAALMTDVRIVSFDAGGKSLEDIFIKITGDYSGAKPRAASPANPSQAGAS